MQKKFQSILAALLVLVMVLGMIPFTTMAAQSATEQTEKNSDMLAEASFASGNVSWNGSDYGYDRKSTVTNGADSLYSWRFTRKGSDGYTYPSMQINLGNTYDLTNQDLVFDIKADPALDLVGYSINISLYDAGGNQITQGYYRYFTGDGWHTLTVENGALQAFLLPGMSLSNVGGINLHFTIPSGGAQNIYIDNMHLEARPVATDAQDSAADLLADAKVVGNVANNTTLFYEHDCTDVSYGAQSNTSHKFSAVAGESETLTVKYDLGKSYDLTNKDLVLDMLSYNAGNGFVVKLYNSANQVISTTSSYTTIGQWTSVTPAILLGLQSGKNLSDVRYVSIGAKFDTNTPRTDRAFYVDNVRIEEIDVHYTPLQNKNVVFMGDSITAALGYKGWSGELQEHYGINRYNLGVGGTSYSDVANRTPIYNQLKSIPSGVDVDFFVLNGGVNDVWSAIEDLGTVSDIPVSSAKVEDFNYETTASGMEKVFCYLRTNYPNAQIAFVINYICYTGDWDGVRFRDEFVPLAKQICDKWGVPYLDLVNNTQFNAEFSAIYGQGTFDGVHGNDHGYERCMREIAPWLISLCKGTEQTEQNTDRLAHASYSYSASDWTGAGSLSYANNCTETYGSESIRSWKFSATAAQKTNPTMLVHLGNLNRFDLDGKELAFDVKFEASNGKPTQKIGIQFYNNDWKAVTSTVWATGDGSADWQTITMDASVFEAALSAGMKLEDIAFLNITFNFADNAGNTQTVYMDNLRIVNDKATEASEAASDLLYGATYVDGYFTTAGFGYDQKNTSYVSGTDSKYSLRFFAADNKTAWTTATFKLPKAIDLTTNSLEFDVIGHNQRAVVVDLYDSNMKLVTNDTFTVRNDGWQTFEINSLFGLAKDKTADDLKEISYIRFSFSFEKAETGRTIIIDNLNIYANEQYDTNISGMTGLYLGDSISEAISYKGWAGEMAEHYGVNGVNVSASGAVVINNQTHNIHQQLAKAPKDVEFDFVMLNGGVNDVWKGHPLGSVSPEGTTTFDVNTTMGALEDLFSKLKATYPNSQIVFILNYVCVQNGYPSDTFRDVYAPLAREACAKWDIHCLDLVDNDAFNAEFDATANVHTYDGVHPNKPGYDVLTAYIVDYLEDVMLDESQDPYWTLEKNETVDLNLTEDLYVNLNGYTLSGIINTNGFNIYAIDSTTDKYTCDKMGYFAAVDAQGNAIAPVAYFRSYANGTIKRYVTIETESGYTFHRFYVGITKQSLAPNVTGVGYKAVFCGDEMVQAIMDENKAYGYELKLEGYAPISRSKDRNSFVSGKEVTLRVNNFDVENHGETNLYATVWVNLYGEKICSSEYTLTLRQMVETVNADYKSYTQTQLQAVRDMVNANPVMENWEVANLFKQDVVRGDYFAAGENTVIDIVNAAELGTLSFEYRIVEGEEFSIALLPDWSNYYGYFTFSTKGAGGAYEGVTVEPLDDGYFRVTFNLAKLNAFAGTPTKVIDFLYIRGGWSDATGYIDNVVCTEATVEPDITDDVYEGGQFVANQDLSINMENDQEVVTLTFDYKIDNDGYFHIALLPDWSNYFGYFKFDTNGVVGNYAGVTTEKLSDGNVRVTVDMAALTTMVGHPSKVLTILYVRGGWSTANGTISNIHLSHSSQVAPRGEALAAGFDKTIMLENTENLKTLSFDYKITKGNQFAMALMPNWSSFYGYYEFAATGPKATNEGVTAETLDDGYVRVTFDMEALTKINGTPTTALEFLYIRGGWSDATGYIDNVQFTTETVEPEQPTEPETPSGSEIVTPGGSFAAGEDLIVNFEPDAYEVVTFDYKITNGGEMAVCLLQTDWQKFYGYFNFDANGTTQEYAGVSTEKLSNGYIRATLVLAELNKTNFNENRDNAPETVGVLYVRGGWSTAAGTIDNVRCLTKVDSGTEPEQPTEPSEPTDPTEPEPDAPVGAETVSGDWTNMAVDQGISTATYSMSNEHTVSGSERSLKITTKAGDVGGVYLNASDAVEKGNLAKLPDFTSGKFTAWFYFGDQRPMAFLRGIDSNWNKGVTGIFQLEDKGNGWYYGELAASELEFEVRATNTKTSEMIRVAIEVPGDSTVYVDNLKWEPISVTEQTEKATDLLAVSTVVTGASTITPETCTDMVSGLNSLYSHKFTAAAGVAQKKSVRYELPKSYDMTSQALSVDVYRYDVDKTYGIMMVSLQDSQGNTVVDALVDNVYWMNWNHIEVDLYKYLEEGKSLSDVKYVTFTFYFDKHTNYDRVYYLDNMTITPYETYDTVLKGTSALYIGDSISISKPFKGWAGLLEERYGVDRTNVSVGGTTFSTTGTQIKNQLANVPEDAEFDYIILDGGINDLYLSCPDLGKVSDLPLTAAPSKFDDSTAIGAFEQLISMLKRRYPNAKIGFVITYQRIDKWVNEFVPEVKKACDKWGVSYLSLPDTYEFMQLFNTCTGAHTTDTVHANVAGYNLIMEHLPQWMAAIPAPEAIEGFEPEQGKEVFAGGEFAAGVGLTAAMDNQNAVSKLSFDYKITNNGYFNIALLPDWNNFYGYFKFDSNGASYSYAGVVTRKLEDGSIRVYVDMAALTTITGTPSKVLTALFIRGDWSTANGTISNICINGAVETPPRGEVFTAGVNKTFDPVNLGNLKKISFEYKITEGTQFNIALLPNWSSYYGYYNFNATGSVNAYNGVTTEVLEDGYVRVTFDMDALTNTAGTPTTAIDFLYFRGDWSDASGYIDNVQFFA